MLKGFLGGAVAVPPLANVGVGVIIPTRAQQKWLGSEPLDWLKHQSYQWNVACHHTTGTTLPDEINPQEFPSEMQPGRVPHASGIDS
uniref:Uncharacterized protein n=1 Tax=Romanomermis culicivorax TaxID=13658 RepID=A0A915LBW2_ROMCU